MNMREYQKRAHKTATYPSLYDLVRRASARNNVETRETCRDPETDYPKFRKEVETNPYYPALGLAGEVGEFCNKLKKVMRDKDGEITEVFREYAQGELGDILWYVSECATSLGLGLDIIAQHNIDKLASRAAREKICGEGDNR